MSKAESTLEKGLKKSSSADTEAEEKLVGLCYNSQSSNCVIYHHQENTTKNTAMKRDVSLPKCKSKGASNLYVFHLGILNILHELRLLIIKLKEAKQKRNYLGATPPIIL